MSGRVKMIKAKNMTIGVDRTHDLTKFRSKFNYDGNDALSEWVKTLPISEKDEKLVPTSVTFFKEPNPKKENEKPLPSQLRPFVDYMAQEKRVPDDEIRGWTFHVLNPSKVKSDREISFEQCKVYVSDRFIYIYGSNEKFTYHVIDISKAKAISNLAPNQQIIEDIEEQVKSGSVVHLEFLAAISMLLKVNDQGSFRRPSRKGFQEGVMIPKNPLRRTIVVLDIIATTKKATDVLLKKVQMFDEILEEKPDSKQAKIIRSFKEDMDKENKTGEENNEEVPELVNVETKETSAMETLVSNLPDNKESKFDIVDEEFKEISDNF